MRLRLPGSHQGNRQVRPCEENKAALSVLILRNVLIETRDKTFIHMELNQNHASCIEFGKTLVEKLSCPHTDGCRASVLLTPVDPSQGNVSSQPRLCLSLPDDTSLHKMSPSALVLHWWWCEHLGRWKSSSRTQKWALIFSAGHRYMVPYTQPWIQTSSTTILSLSRYMASLWADFHVRKHSLVTNFVCCLEEKHSPIIDSFHQIMK